MSDPDLRSRRTAVIAAIAAASMLLAGCGGVKRAWDGFFPPASAEPEAPLPPPRGNPWVPLGSPWIQPSASAAPVWPTGRYTGGGQADGMATLVQELDHFARLVDTVSRMPPDPGEFRVNFTRIQADVAAVRAGLVEAMLQPHAAPREFPPINRDYLE